MKVKNGNLPETHHNMCSTAVVEEPENMSFSNFLGNVHSILCKINWIMIATCIWGCNTINFMKDEKIAKMEKKLTKMLKMEKNLWSKNLYNRLGNMMVGRVNENTGVLAAVVTLVREKMQKMQKIRDFEVFFWRFLAIWSQFWAGICCGRAPRLSIPLGELLGPS